MPIGGGGKGYNLDNLDEMPIGGKRGAVMNDDPTD